MGIMRYCSHLSRQKNLTLRDRIHKTWLPQYKRLRHQRRPYCTLHMQWENLLTFLTCICKQVFAVSVYFLFTSLIFLWVCSSFLFMLSMRLWFFVPLHISHPKKSYVHIESWCSISKSSEMWRLENVHMCVHVLKADIKKKEGKESLKYWFEKFVLIQLLG